MKTINDMAFEYAMAFIKGSCSSDVEFDFNFSIIASEAFDFAEAMQAEAEKRKDKSRPDVLNSTKDNHEWIHINYMGSDGGYYVCCCGAEKHPDICRADEDKP